MSNDPHNLEPLPRRQKGPAQMPQVPAKRYLADARVMPASSIIHDRQPTSNRDAPDEQ